MAVVTGSLSDFGLQSLASVNPRIIFTPSGAGTKGAQLFSSTAVVVSPDVNGAFSVTLAATDGVTPEVWYEVSIEHLNSGGAYTHFDVLGYRLYLPEVGGAIGDMPGAPLRVDTVLVSLAPPPAGYRGWYLNAPGPGVDPGDPDDPASSGTGVLEIVS